MASKQEITDAIRQGIADVDATFGSLTDEQLATQIHEGDGGWTAKDNLAHLAGRAPVYQLMAHLAAGGSVPTDGSFSIGTFNQEQVDMRRDKSRDELLEEFRTVHQGLADSIAGIDDSLLESPVAIGPQAAPYSERLKGSGGTHSTNHANEVRQALGLA